MSGKGGNPNWKKGERDPTTGSWKKGVSGNPGGRKRYPEGDRVKELALKKCPWALQRLEQLARQNDDLRSAVAATMGILAYGLGKPMQQVDLSNKDGSLADIFRRAVLTANGITAEAPEDAGRSGTTH